MTQKEFIPTTITTEATTEEITETTDKIIITTMDYAYYDGKDPTVINSERMPKIFMPKILLPHDGTTN